MTLSEFHHSQAKAFIDIGGYQIPTYYQNAVAEFHAAQKAAIMDRSFIGKLRVSGKDRETLLHRLTTNEMRHLPVGAGVVNIFTNAKGRVVDVVEMFTEAESIFLLTSPGRVSMVKQWIEKYTFIEEVRCEDLTAQFGVISLLGEESAALLQKVFAWDVGNLPAQHTRTFVVEGRRVLVQRSGLITPVQFNLMVAADDLKKFWQLLITQATPAGHAAYEMLRIHRGLPRMEKEITDEYNPHEVGLLPFINFDKGCYIGQEVIARLDSYQKVQRQLAGVRLDLSAPDDKLFAATPAPIYVGEQLAGQLTSACFSPKVGMAVGLAVIRKQFAMPAVVLEVRWPERSVQGYLLGADNADLR
ncbi:MAG: Aminomethyltransferase [bacterium]|nr:Aminomethyltransferase [bacterium]